MAELLERIRREIRSHGPLAFARFMELALYDPDGGYYMRGSPVGPAGDFVTASDRGRGFGRAIARQLAEIDRRAGPFDPFHVVEFGAGRGLLARDVLAELGQDVRYVAVDRSPAMRAASREAAPSAQVL
ncbi:MAG TPA: SAM-dependent methyltransferase, partial [Candidatus Polarisedimenticolaceae bacterium]|nr:SAM-dependent methyltransferase [Candidatus Polarisedimenticolaceae bacterium]